MNPTSLAAALTAVVCAAPAFAASDRVVLDRPIPASSAPTAQRMPQAGANLDRAEVISATPVIRQVTVPQRHCVDQLVMVQREPSGAGALIGAVAGAAVGNAVGHGSGRAAATALGLIGGAALGNQVETGGNDGVATRLERRCSTQTSYEDRTVGYDVVYEYNGREFTTRMRNDPGDFVQVHVQATGDVLPAPSGRRRSGQAAPLVPSGAAPAPAYAPAYVEPVYESSAPAPAPYYHGGYYVPAPYYAPSYAPSYVPFGAGLAIGALIGFGGHRHHGGWHGGWRGGRR